ncbi:MAG: class I SAM-dependent methyltransferase [Gemmatimonadaceae bacterium]
MMPTHAATSDSPDLLKDVVRSHWDAQPCGTLGVPASDRRAFFEQVERERYEWEPYIRDFARFERGRDKKLLEVGVGAGTDFTNWVRNGAIATGVDLTEHGVALTRERLELEGLKADVRVADAENLPFETNTFDLVYSHGVLHHSPDTPRAIREVHRVLRPGGTALVMIYNVHSWVGFMLWSVHALGRLKPWKSPRWAIYNYLESPGTKAYSIAEGYELFRDFTRVAIRTHLGHGDLLLMRRSAKYQDKLHELAWRLYPRWLVRQLGHRFGMNMFIEAVK